ncbi:unnamed protein product [Owenia fusiformis]|uniref:Dynein regulatory complex protein 10 n=1 Tax=Owenia fusiformis TaxID=6347 RepID=A0A8J1XP26_OWEFU|nr:unnamed protein product [Owenia fusiformis]
MATMTEVQPVEVVQMRIQQRSNHAMSQNKQRQRAIKLDPLRALEPARKKLTTVESQRILTVLEETIKRSEMITILPYLMDNMDRFAIVLGNELVNMLKTHRVMLDSYKDLKSNTERLIKKKDRKGSPKLKDDGSRASSASSIGSSRSIDDRLESSIHNLHLVANQITQSCKNILRAFSLNPSAVNTLRGEKSWRSIDARTLIGTMSELKEIILEKLLTTPVEELEKQKYLEQITDRERQNATVIHKLEAELAAAEEDKESEIKKKNDVIRKLQADLFQIDKFSQEHIRRTKQEAEKQESADVKNSEGKKQKLTQEVNQLSTQMANLVTEHREHEQSLRKRKYKIETEVENWIQKYDQDMGERQDEFEEIDAVYTEEKKQLNELEERFKTLEAEYNSIMEERRISRERREAQEREMQAAVKAATTIQAYWRSFKVRKALKARKKGKKGKGKKGKK